MSTSQGDNLSTTCDTVYVEPSLVVLEPVQNSASRSSYGDSDSEDDITMSSNDAAYRAAQGRLLGINGGMHSVKKDQVTNTVNLRKKRAASWQNQQNDLCAQQRLRAAWASAQSDQSLRCRHEETLGP